MSLPAGASRPQPSSKRVAVPIVTVRGYVHESAGLIGAGVTRAVLVLWAALLGLLGLALAL